MIFNVLRELRQALGTVNEYEFREPHVVAEDVRIDDLDGTVRFLRTDRGLLARVRALGKEEAVCARCLRRVEASVDVDFEEEYVPTFDAHTGSAVYLAEDDEAFRIGMKWELDLREALRQYILMCEPQKPLCRPDCAGLCPTCGADLNAGPHECEQPSDERWSALAGLKNETSEGN